MTIAPLLVGLLVEGPSDARTVPSVVDSVLVVKVPIEPAALGDVRVYRGLDSRKPYVAWKEIDHESRQRRAPRKHGHFRGEPGVEDAQKAVNALLCFVAQQPQPAAVILVRDSDGKKEEREKGLKQARDEREWPFEVIIGVAHAMRENWVISAFEPRDKEEMATLSELRAELGLNPIHRSEELTATNEAAKRSSKRVLHILTDGSHEREEVCFLEVSLGDLRNRGVGNGLAAFVGEIEEKLVPLIQAVVATDN